MKTEEIIKKLSKGVCKFSNVDNLVKYGYFEWAEFHLKNVTDWKDSGVAFVAETEHELPETFLKKYHLEKLEDNKILIGYSSALRAIQDK